MYMEKKPLADVENTICGKMTVFMLAELAFLYQELLLLNQAF